jgi:endonuclease-8
MPEGDTIARAARTLDGALAGRTLTRFEAPRLRGSTPRPGTTIEGVDARGKHLLVRFGDGRVLHTHMQMTGSWHVYPAGSRWRKPAHLARVVLEVDDGTVAVCFSAPTVEMLTGDLRSLTPGSRPGGAAGLGSLGPDLCRSDVDLDEAVRRMGALDLATEVAVALLDQRVAAGVGNVYKSEVCFACGIDPRAPLGTVEDATRRRLLETASQQLRANLDGPRRTTVPGGLAVYGRAGLRCRRCGDRIRRIRQGPTPRSTYYCPTCQPARAAPR